MRSLIALRLTFAGGGARLRQRRAIDGRSRRLPKSILVLLCSLVGTLPAHALQGGRYTMGGITLIACYIKFTARADVTLTWKMSACWTSVYEYHLPYAYNGQSVYSPGRVIVAPSCVGTVTPLGIYAAFSQPDSTHIYVNTVLGTPILGTDNLAGPVPLGYCAKPGPIH
jgi:hypothetical protein